MFWPLKLFVFTEDKTDLRCFLGLTEYYRNYIRNFAEVASSFTGALRTPDQNVC